MDADAALDTILALANQVLRGDLSDAERLADRILDLHDWLARGGHKPHQWLCD